MGEMALDGLPCLRVLAEIGLVYPPGVKNGDSGLIHPCVDGPSGARGKSALTGREGCIHVSGLLSQPLAAGLDEFRGSTPKSPCVAGKS